MGMRTTPWVGALVKGLFGGPLLKDFLVTVWRTVQAFLIAAAVGMPLGVLLGSNERAYRSVEFLIDFFRSTPSSALIPLFLLMGKGMACKSFKGGSIPSIGTRRAQKALDRHRPCVLSRLKRKS